MPDSASAQHVAPSRGVLFVHACRSILCERVEWALSAVVDRKVELDWVAQPALSGHLRAELCWTGMPGSAAAFTSALRSIPQLRFEATEEPCHGREGERFAVTPDLGLFRAAIGIHGDVLVPEDRLRAALMVAEATGASLAEEVDRLLGGPWDLELEPFRWAGEGAPVRWLHQAG